MNINFLFKEPLSELGHLKMFQLVSTAYGLDIALLENELAKRKNPILIIPQRSLGKFISHSGCFERNRYAYRVDIAKYYLYHKMIDVKILDLNHDDIFWDRLLVTERDDDYNYDFNDFCLFCF